MTAQRPPLHREGGSEAARQALGPIHLALIAMLQEAARTRATERERRRSILTIVEDPNR